MEGTKRKRLGRRSSLSSREYVYQAKDCFELDEVQNYDVSRQRVFFDDVLLVTLHRFIPWVRVVTATVLVGLLGILALVVGVAGGRAQGFTFFALACLPLAYLLLLLFLRGTGVTIQGRRTRIRMDFGLRSGRARDVYLLACRLVRDAQRDMAPRRPPTAV